MTTRLTPRPHKPQQASPNTPRRDAPSRSLSMLVVAGIIAAALAILVLIVISLSDKKQTSNQNVAANTKAVDEVIGVSGFPVPRFVSLKTEKVNARKGPSSDYPVAWIYQAKGLPVEVIAEFETWRRVRDSEGSEGWILQQLLSGKRTFTAAPWQQDKYIPLYEKPDKAATILARLEPKSQGDIENCDGSWCLVTIGDFTGYLEQTALWGAYPGEVFD